MSFNGASDVIREYVQCNDVLDIPYETKLELANFKQLKPAESCIQNTWFALIAVMKTSGAEFDMISSLIAKPTTKSVILDTSRHHVPTYPSMHVKCKKCHACTPPLSHFADTLCLLHN